jgi:hypothetical protein
MNPVIGDRVQLRRPLPYLKTADPMPMLRPADLVTTEEPGELVGLRPLNTAVVRFRRGTFLIPLDQLLRIPEADASAGAAP